MMISTILTITIIGATGTETVDTTRYAAMEGANADVGAEVIATQTGTVIEVVSAGVTNAEADTEY